MLVQAGGAREEGRRGDRCSRRRGWGRGEGGRLCSRGRPAELDSQVPLRYPPFPPKPLLAPLFPEARASPVARRPRRTGKSSAGTFLVVPRGFSVSSAGPRTPRGSKPLALPATGGSSWVFWLRTGPRESHAVKGAARRELRAEGGRGRETRRVTRANVTAEREPTPSRE